MIFGRVLSYAARRVAMDPRAREMAVRAARSVADEARVVASDKEPLKAASKSVRRMAGKVMRPPRKTGGDGTG